MKPDKPAEHLPATQKWANIILIIDGGGEFTIKLYANSIQQEAICYFNKNT